MPTIKLLWTGGMDSTLRLLQLILLEQVSVQPIYLIDPNRKSIRQEFQAVNRVRNLLLNKHPETEARLLPLEVVFVPDIAKNAEITASYESLKSEYKLGSQYDWMARFCEMRRYRDVEACLTTSFTHPTVLKHMLQGAEGKISIAPNAPAELHRVFGWYSLPLLYTSKREIFDSYDANAWSEFLTLTWFCHKPDGDHPCGKCNPCLDAKRHGIGERLPPLARLGASLRLLLGR